MIRNLITLIFFFLVGWLVYTQILGLGTDEEKKAGKELVQNTKKTISTVFSILGNEGKKIKGGTYDDALNKLGSLLDNLRSQNNQSSEVKAQLESLKKEEQRIKKELAEAKENTNSDQPLESNQEEKTREDLKKLTKDIEKVVKLIDVANE